MNRALTQVGEPVKPILSPFRVRKGSTSLSLGLDATERSAQEDIDYSPSTFRGQPRPHRDLDLDPLLDAQERPHFQFRGTPLCITTDSRFCQVRGSDLRRPPRLTQGGGLATLWRWPSSTGPR